MVRGDRIVSQRRQAELLSPGLQAKIGRYICRWKRRYDGNWPKYPIELPEGTRPPSLVELWCDWITYQGVLCRDKMVAVIYAIVPIDLARWLRSWLRQRSHKRGLLPMSQ